MFDIEPGGTLTPEQKDLLKQFRVTTEVPQVNELSKERIQEITVKVAKEFTELQGNEERRNNEWGLGAYAGRVKTLIDEESGMYNFQLRKDLATTILGNDGP